MNREVKLNVNISGYEGPLDLLIDLSKKQRVDITKVSILELAEQYLKFVNHNLYNLKLSADYLKSAAVSFTLLESPNLVQINSKVRLYLLLYCKV